MNTIGNEPVRQAFGDVVADHHSKPSLGICGAQGDQLGRLIANGYGRHIRVCPPPGAFCWRTDPQTKQVVQTVSDGKVPGQSLRGEWYGLRRWREYTPTEDDFTAWRQLQAANLCIVTGDVVAFDIDVKVDDNDVSEKAKNARALVAEIKEAVAEALGVTTDRLPLRWRPGTTSSVIFARASERLGKRSIHFEDGHAIEFLADGQQVVVSGVHKSGSSLCSHLIDTPFSALPAIDDLTLGSIMDAIGARAARLGFKPVGAKTLQRRSSTVRSPEQVVLREAMSRRLEWVPDVLPAGPSDVPEWRISSAALDRDLEEDLAIYADGVYDHGTRRSHTPASVIAEFGAIDATGLISFGGSPEYESRGEMFFVAGEPDPAIRRPTEAQALTWLCRTLSGRDNFPAAPETATWRSHWEKVGEALGLVPELLTVAMWFQAPANSGLLTSNSFSEERDGDYLAALQAVDPAEFGKLAFALDLSGVDAVAIAKARREAVARSDLENAATAAGGSATEGFPEPFDIFSHADVGDLGALPADCLPPMLQRWVRSEARRKGAPESFAAAAAVGVAASAIGASRKIQVRSLDAEYTQPASLWVMLVADPGSAKSPIISAAVKPLQQIENEWMAVDHQRHSAWCALAPKKRGEADTRGPEPWIRRALIDDITTERQVRLHAQNPRGLLRHTDEMESIFGSFGAYKKSGDGDRTLMLRLFSGDTVKVDRVGNGVAGIHAKHALMGVLGGTQPAKLRSRIREMSDDGLLQRFIPILHDGVDRHGIDEAADADAAQAYALALRLLVSSEMHSSPIRLRADAQELLDREVRQIAALKHVPGAPLAWRGHVEKWEMLLARIVLTFHMLDQAFSGQLSDNAPVTIETTRRAVRFARFLLRHALYFYLTYFDTDRTADDAQIIAGFILTKPEVQLITPRTVGEWRKEFRGEKERPRLRSAMSALVIAGWLQVVEQDAAGSAKWRVNPEVHLRFAEHAERERKSHHQKRQAIVEAGKARKAIASDEFPVGGA